MLYFPLYFEKEKINLKKKGLIEKNLKLPRSVILYYMKLKHTHTKTKNEFQRGGLTVYLPFLFPQAVLI